MPRMVTVLPWWLAIPFWTVYAAFAALFLLCTLVVYTAGLLVIASVTVYRALR